MGQQPPFRPSRVHYDTMFRAGVYVCVCVCVCVCVTANLNMAQICLHSTENVLWKYQQTLLHPALWLLLLGVWVCVRVLVRACVIRMPRVER